MLIPILFSLCFIGFAFTGFITTCRWLHYACTRQQCTRCQKHLKKSFGFCPACGHSRHALAIEKETRTKKAEATRRVEPATPGAPAARAVLPEKPREERPEPKPMSEAPRVPPPIRRSPVPANPSNPTPVASTPSSHTSLVAERQDHEVTSTIPSLQHSKTPSSSHTSLFAKRQDHEVTSTTPSLQHSKTPSSSHTSPVAERQDHEASSATPSLQHSKAPSSSHTSLVAESQDHEVTSSVHRQAARRNGAKRNWPEILIRSLLYIGVLGMVATLLTLLYSQKELITNTKKFGLVMAFTASVYLLGRTLYLKFKYERTGLAFIFLSFFFVPLNYYAAKAFMLMGPVGSGAKFELRLPPELAEWGIVFGVCGIIYFLVSLRLKEGLMPYVAVITASLGTVLLVWHYSPPWLGWGGAALTCAALLETWRRVSPRYRIPLLIPATGAGIMGCFAYLRYLVLLPESGLFTTGMYGMCVSVAVLALAHQLRWMEKNWVTPALFTFNLLLFLKHFSTGGLNYTGVFFLVAFVLWGIERAWTACTKISNASPLCFDGEEVSRLWRSTSLMVAVFAASFGLLSLLVHTFAGLDFPVLNRGADWMLWSGLSVGAVYFFLRREIWPQGVLLTLLLVGGIVWHWSFLIGLGLHGQVISLLVYTAFCAFMCRTFEEEHQDLVTGFAIIGHLATLGLYLTVQLFVASTIWPPVAALGSAAFLAFLANRAERIGLQAISRLWLQAIAILLTHVSLFFLGVWASWPRELIGLGELLLACAFQWAGRSLSSKWTTPMRHVSGVLIGVACVYLMIDGILGDKALAAMLATLITALNCAGVAWRESAEDEGQFISRNDLRVLAVCLTHTSLYFFTSWLSLPMDTAGLSQLFLACGYQWLGSFDRMGLWVIPLRCVSGIIAASMCALQILDVFAGGSQAVTALSAFVTGLFGFGVAWRDRSEGENESTGIVALQLISMALMHLSLFLFGIHVSLEVERIALTQLLLACLFQWFGFVRLGNWVAPIRKVSAGIMLLMFLVNICEWLGGATPLIPAAAAIITAMCFAGMAWRNASGAEPRTGNTSTWQVIASALTHLSFAFFCEWVGMPLEEIGLYVSLMSFVFHILGSFGPVGDWARPMRRVSASILGMLCLWHLFIFIESGAPLSTSPVTSFLTALCCFNAAWRSRQSGWIYLGGLLTCHSLLFGTLVWAEDWFLLAALQMAAAVVFQMVAWVLRSKDAGLSPYQKAFVRLSWLVMIPASICCALYAEAWTFAIAAAFFAGLCALLQKRKWGTLAFIFLFAGIHIFVDQLPGVNLIQPDALWLTLGLSSATLLLWAFLGKERLKHWFFGGFEVSCWMNFLVLPCVIVHILLGEEGLLLLPACATVMGLCGWISASYRYRRTSFLVFCCGGTLLLSYINGAFRFVDNLSVFASEPAALVGFMLLVPIVVFLMGIRYVVWAKEQENPPIRISYVPFCILCALTTVTGFLMCASSKTFVMFYCVGLACVSGVGFVMLHWQWLLYAGLFLLQPAFFLALDHASVGTSAMRIWAMFMGATLVGIGHLNREHYDNKDNPFVQMGLIVCVLSFLLAFFMPGVFEVQSEALLQTIAATLLAAAVFAATGWVQSQPALFTFAGLSGLMAYYLILLYFPVRQVILYSVPPGLGLILWGAGQRLGRLKKGAVPDTSLIQIGMGILFVPSLFQILFPNQPTAAIMTALTAKCVILLSLRTRIRWMFYLSTSALGLTFAIELHHLLRDVHIPHWAWLGIISLLCIFIGFLSERRFKQFMKERVDDAQSRWKDFFFEWR